VRENNKGGTNERKKIRVFPQAVMGRGRAVKGKNTFERNLITDKLCGKKFDFHRRTTDVIKCFCENLCERL
jgi:hypothetical protein